MDFPLGRIHIAGVYRIQAFLFFSIWNYFDMPMWISSNAIAQQRRLNKYESNKAGSNRSKRSLPTGRLHSQRLNCLDSGVVLYAFIQTSKNNSSPSLKKEYRHEVFERVYILWKPKKCWSWISTRKRGFVEKKDESNTDKPWVGHKQESISKVAVKKKDVQKMERWVGK